MKLLKRLWNDVLDLFYPNPCCACSKPLVGNEAIVCTTCRLALPRSDAHLMEIPTLADKFKGKIVVKSVYTFLKFEKGGKVQRLLHQLKYNNRPDVGQMLGQLYGAELKKAGINTELDVLVPVPLHRRKLAQRGYNQSDVFAKGLSETMGIECSTEVLTRSKFTETQTKKNRFERFENVSGIFEVIQNESIKGKRVAIIDDVMTTGSTLESAIEVLLKSEAKEVSVITLAAAY